MPITFDQEQKLFHLQTNNFSYYFIINEIGMLQHVYFGSPLEEIHLETLLNLGMDWSKTYFSSTEQKEKIYEGNLYTTHSLFEVPTFGYADKRISPIIMETSIDHKCDFRYVSHRIYQGKPSLKGQPHFKDLKNEASSLEVTLRDLTKNVTLILTYSIFENSGVLLRNTTLINNTNQSIFLKKVSSVTLDLPKKELILTHFPGGWSFERMVRQDELSEGIKRIVSNSGRSSHEHNPFFFLSEKTSDENQGDVYAFSHVYSGSFEAEFEVNQWGQTRVNLGINEEEFSFELKPNDIFDFPEGLLAYSSKGFGHLSRQLHDIIRDHLIKIPSMELKEKIILNSWEGCYLDFNTEKILSYIDQAKLIGTELFVLDDGWFINRNDDSNGLGDWIIDEAKIDLKKIINHCHDLGMKFGIWFEPEMINPRSNLYGEHPEYSVGNLNIDRALSRHQFPLDMTNPQVVDTIFAKMTAILDHYDIDYVKWDHNRSIDCAYSSYLKERNGEFYHRMVLGYYRLAELLTKRYPHILFQGCASGGGRFDLGSLFYFPEIWTSDETDPIQRLFIQYGTSYMYPLISMGAHVSKNAITSYATKGMIALFGTYGFEFDPNTLNEKDRSELNEINEIFHNYHQKVIAEGDFYRLSSPFTSNHFAVASISKDKSLGLVLFVNLLKEPREYRFLKIEGLDQNKRYYNSFDKQIYSGDYYHKIGLNFTRWFNEFEAILVILKEVK